MEEHQLIKRLEERRSDFILIGSAALIANDLRHRPKDRDYLLSIDDLSSEEFDAAVASHINRFGKQNPYKDVQLVIKSKDNDFIICDSKVFNAKKDAHYKMIEYQTRGNQEADNLLDKRFRYGFFEGVIVTHNIKRKNNGY